MVTEAYQKAIRKLWFGSCDVFVLKTTVTKATGRSSSKETRILQNEPCRVSYNSIPATSPKSEAAEIRQIIKLFISKDVLIPEGSKLVVTQQGRTEAYKRSGKPAVYSTHQEIVLEAFKEWA